MDAEPLLLPSTPDAVAGAVDYLGRPIARSHSGGWKSGLFIIGVEIAERFAFYGISLNLISYLTGPLCQPTASAAAAINAWSGTSMMLPLVGAFAADSYLGRYRTIILASLLYILSVGMLTLSSLLPSAQPAEDGDTCRVSPSHVAFFYFSLYLMAFAQGGHKPCVQAFGADQFDQNDQEECISRSSFFNWWYFGMSGGILVSVVVLSYIQDNIGWFLGFGIPCIILVFALGLFLLGTKTYRFYQVEEKISFNKIAKALVSFRGNNEGVRYSGNSPDVNTHTEMLRLFPIWGTCLVYGIASAQNATWFTKQGSTLDRRIGSNIQVPPAALQCLISGSVVALMPIYDGILVPFMRRFSKIPSGITVLQRIGTGMFLSLLSMAIAAPVETKRLKVARDAGLVDQHNAPLPMSIWWLFPQYILVGMSELLAFVGLQEFLYDQVPDALRSLGLAIYLSIFGIGSFLSSILISIIDEVPTRNGENWFPNNLNRGHLDYFYWLLAFLSALSLLMYVHFAKAYDYRTSSRKRAI